jgi:hypothetical protein
MIKRDKITQEIGSLYVQMTAKSLRERGGRSWPRRDEKANL